MWPARKPFNRDALRISVNDGYQLCARCGEWLITGDDALAFERAPGVLLVVHPHTCYKGTYPGEKLLRNIEAARHVTPSWDADNVAASFANDPYVRHSLHFAGYIALRRKNLEPFNERRRLKEVRENDRSKFLTLDRVRIVGPFDSPAAIYGSQKRLVGLPQRDEVSDVLNDSAPNEATGGRRVGLARIDAAQESYSGKDNADETEWVPTSRRSQFTNWKERCLVPQFDWSIKHPQFWLRTRRYFCLDVVPYREPACRFVQHRDLFYPDEPNAKVEYWDGEEQISFEPKRDKAKTRPKRDAPSGPHGLMMPRGRLSMGSRLDVLAAASWTIPSKLPERFTDEERKDLAAKEAALLFASGFAEIRVNCEPQVRQLLRWTPDRAQRQSAPPSLDKSCAPVNRGEVLAPSSFSRYAPNVHRGKVNAP